MGGLIMEAPPPPRCFIARLGAGSSEGRGQSGDGGAIRSVRSAFTERPASPQKLPLQLLTSAPVRLTSAEVDRENVWLCTPG